MILATVHEPPDAPLDRVDRAETLAFVRDRFSFAAFLLGPLWLLSGRMWRGLGLYLLAASTIAVVVLALRLGPAWLVLLLAALNLIVGFEAPSLRRWSLERRGWRMLGMVSGRDIEDCERRFLSTWLPDQEMGLATALAGRPPSPQAGLPGMADGDASDTFGRKPARGWLPWRRRQ